MTKKEMEMQIALGTLEFDKLSRNDQARYLIITTALIFGKPWTQSTRNMVAGTRTPELSDPRPYKDSRTGV